MLRRFLLFATLYSSACQLTEQLRFTFQRSGYGTGNAITLFCYNDQGIQINLMMNDSVKFFVNRTIPGPDLGRLVELTRSEDGTSVSFIITRELEGQYACGTVDPAPLVTSNYVPLVVLPSSDGFLMNSRIYAVQSTETEVRIPCSFQPGMLYACYFGEWFKNSIRIFSIGKPNDRTCGSVSPGRQIMNTDTSKYRVDEETFELIISQVNANDDSAQYECQLYVLNPASMEGQTEQFRSIPTTLIIDGQPMITEPPEDVIIGLDNTEEGLMETATFKCTATGQPIPVIVWLYFTANQDGSLGMPIELDDNKYNIMNNDSDIDSTGRFNRMSTLTMPVTENDGGIIRCKASDSSYKDAYLTVLSEPTINIIATLRGEIIYDIGLKVHISHPVTLNFTYQDVNSRRIFMRDSQPDEIYDDTKEITYRENREDIPSGCKKCHVTVSLTAKRGNQFIQGLSVTSSDVIDLGATTPEQTINNLTIGVSVSCAILGTTIAAGAILIAVICCYQKKQLKSDQEHKNEIICKDIQRIEDNVDHLGHSNDEAYKSRVRSDIQKQLKELEKYVCPATVVSDGPDDTLQVDLDYINQSLGGILNKLQKSEKPSEDSHHYMAMLTIT